MLVKFQRNGHVCPGVVFVKTHHNCTMRISLLDILFSKTFLWVFMILFPISSKLLLWLSSAVQNKLDTFLKAHMSHKWDNKEFNWKYLQTMISWDDVVKVVTTTLVLRNTETGAIFLQSTNTCSLKQLYTHRGRNHRLTYRVLTFRLSISSFALLSTMVPRYNTTSNKTP